MLDTWFSSGLFPFATMGWPDEASPDFKVRWRVRVYLRCVCACGDAETLRVRVAASRPHAEIATL